MVLILNGQSECFRNIWWQTIDSHAFFFFFFAVIADNWNFSCGVWPLACSLGFELFHDFWISIVIPPRPPPHTIFPIQVGSHGAVLCLWLLIYLFIFFEFFFFFSCCTAGGVSTHHRGSFVLWPVAPCCVWGPSFDLLCWHLALELPCQHWGTGAPGNGQHLLRLGGNSASHSWPFSLSCSGWDFPPQRHVPQNHGDILIEIMQRPVWNVSSCILHCRTFGCKFRINDWLLLFSQ